MHYNTIQVDKYELPFHCGEYVVYRSLEGTACVSYFKRHAFRGDKVCHEIAMPSYLNLASQFCFADTQSLRSVTR